MKIHARPANTTVGRKTSAAVLSNSPTGAAGPQNFAPDSGGPRFPGDLTFHGGNVVVSVQHHAIYMNPKGACTITSCWGDPEGFLSDLGKSEFIHIVDQYTGNTADDRYTVSNTHVTINYKPNAAPFTDADMRAVVHAAAAALGYRAATAANSIVFLPPGQDECFNLGFKVCYSPDDPKTFAFCAYHSSADFSDVGHVLCSVEPFQDASGCSSKPGTPNGQLADSTITCSPTRRLKRSRTRTEQHGGTASTMASLGKRSVMNAVSFSLRATLCFSIPAMSLLTARAT